LKKDVPSSIESSFTSAAGFGAGLGNVEDKMLPTSMQTSEFMFQHINDPRTVSIIGYVHVKGNIIFE